MVQKQRLIAEIYSSPEDGSILRSVATKQAAALESCQLFDGRGGLPAAQSSSCS